MKHLKSPAKLNLFLRVSHKRFDGYHELASLFQTIDLWDELTLEFSDTDRLICSHTEVPTDGSNLILKAARLYREKSGKIFGLKATLLKQIPMQAGLGGGSSNAATTLWGLNQMFGSPYSEEELQEWSAELGSDVPFFFSKGSAYCTGRGEKVEPISALPNCKIALTHPPISLATPLIYRSFDEDRVSSWDPGAALNSWQKGVPFCRNDLELPAFELYPIIFDLKKKLSKTYPHSLMTGSGSTLFSLTDSGRNTFVTREKGWYGELSSDNL